MTADKLHRLLKVTLSQCETCPLRSEEAFREAQTALAHGLFRAFTQR